MIDHHVTVYFDTRILEGKGDFFSKTVEYEPHKFFQARAHKAFNHSHFEGVKDFEGLPRLLSSILGKVDKSLIAFLCEEYQPDQKDYFSNVDIGVWRRDMAHASWDGDLIEKYQDYFYLRFENGFDSVPEALEGFLANLDVYNGFDLDWTQLFVFTKELNTESFFRAFKIYNGMKKMYRKLGEKVSVVEKEFFQEQPWKNILQE